MSSMFRLRPFAEFVAKFEPPKQNKWRERVETNLRYYAANYLLLAAVIVFSFLLRSPFAFLFAALLGGLWAFFLLVRYEPLEVGSIYLDVRQVTYVLAGVTSLFVLLTPLGYALLYGGGTAATVVLAHASLRSRDMQSKVTRLKEKIGTMFETKRDDDYDD
eukprot:GILK01009205.1.p1 GENE.GILK01009205.1~~GILK01009205.1.p1  ORF type:complete len:161 (-),score=20.33 GILK01009205.1:252-734(-)